MKKVIVFALALYAMPAALIAQGKKAVITISNNSGLNRTGSVVAVDWKQVVSRYPGIDTANFKVLDGSGKEITYQLEYRGGNVPLNLLVQLNIAAKATAKLTVVPGKHGAFQTKTFGRYVPERKDDFAWENDKIAFRMYGKALESTPKENAYGMDVWVKRTDRMILNERYKRGEYHVDHGDGMDYYHVGLTLGAGDNAPIVKDSIYYPLNYRRWKILDQGPLRFTFQLAYDAWKAGDRELTVTKTVSLDAGSQLNRVEAAYTYAGDGQLGVAVGIIRRQEPGNIVLNEQQGIMAYWEPQHGADGITAVGAILSGPKLKMKVTNEQLLTQSTVKNNEPLVYYSGAAWNKANQITNAGEWFRYLTDFKQQLEAPLKVEVQ